MSGTEIRDGVSLGEIISAFFDIETLALVVSVGFSRIAKVQDGYLHSSLCSLNQKKKPRP